MTCLDTTVLVDLLRANQNQHHRAAEERIKRLWAGGEFLFTTRINVAEVLVGANRANDPAVEKSRIDRLLQPIVILELDEESAEQFAVIKANAFQTGRLSGDADMLIAAIAQVNNCSLLTRNLRHFQNVQGLKVEAY